MASSLNSDGELHPHVSSQVSNESLPNPMRYLAFRRTHTQTGSIGPVVSKPPSNSRGAVVKVGIVEASEHSTLGQKTGRHMNYLTREGTGPHGSEAELFTKAEGQKMDPKEFRLQADQDTHQYRIVLSLADGNRVNMQRFTRDFMSQVEQDLQRNLSWVAAVHDDTAIRHVHIDLRGTDQQGKDVAINTGHVTGTDEDGHRFTIKTHYLHNGMRYRAQQLATEYLGRVKVQDQPQDVDRTATLDASMTQHAAQAKRAADVEDNAHMHAVSARITPDEKHEVIAQMSPQAQAFLKSAVPQLFTNGHSPTTAATDELRTKYMATTAQLRERIEALKIQSAEPAKTQKTNAQEYEGGLGR
jgi:hypothetical protein